MKEECEHTVTFDRPGGSKPEDTERDCANPTRLDASVSGDGYCAGRDRKRLKLGNDPEAAIDSDLLPKSGPLGV
jgi:hypothetical protein